MGESNQRLMIYSRKSRFTGRGESVENQVELCRQYIAAHYGPEEAARAQVYEDEGFSGGSLERPQFKQMMADAKAQKPAAIVVYRLDRISRNIGDFAGLIEQLGGMGIDFVSIKEQFDTGSPMGRAMMYISSVFSQLERETIAERIRDNMHELAKTGRWLGGTTPTGYRSESVTQVTIDGKTKRACHLNPLPGELRLVELIFQKFLETGSLTQVDTFLLEKQYRTKRGNPFTRVAIRNILTNPVYLIADGEAYQYLTGHGAEVFGKPEDFDGVRGILAYNRTLQQPGKTHRLRPMEEWIVAVGRHPGIIPGAKWVQVQDRLARNRDRGYRSPRSHEALLSGLLRCGYCGDYLRPKLTGRTGADGARQYAYLCTTKERSKGSLCTMKNPNGNQLDAQVLAAIAGLDRDPAQFREQLARGRKALHGAPTGCGEELERLREEIGANSRQIQGLVAALPQASGTAAQAYILEQIEACHSREAGLNARLKELEAEAAGQDLPEEEFARLCRRLSSFRGTVEGMTIEEKRAALRHLVSRIVWDEAQAQVFLTGSKPQGEDSK